MKISSFINKLFLVDLASSWTPVCALSILLGYKTAAVRTARLRLCQGGGEIYTIVTRSLECLQLLCLDSVV